MLRNSLIALALLASSTVAAQAVGDAKVLEQHGRPVLRLNVIGSKGVDEIAKALS